MTLLETERLIIREFTNEDTEAVHAYASDPLVAKYMIWGPKDFEFAVVLKETGQLIGGCGIHISEPGQGEIGYCFNPLFWRQGYTSEAAASLLDFGFQELNLHRIYATCRPENVGSAKVMQKLGMVYEGHLREHMWHKGRWHDSYQYSVLKPEYELQRGRRK
ncbi:GCN5 family acetyltransferase [Paenibacillus riograndensis]|uniref:GCN5 family acetyltransferase n=1 Tax=Paenibacillus riograndensis TaxID=483937 RepID=A0A132U1R0_9BACL|nr:GNAT family protein [Paenibacillus riograndensis]KWX77508.1 GCN5 family acetyltransferase [Paenibacillus riograndensis]